jgi:dethiobiotin synthetase
MLTQTKVTCTDTGKTVVADILAKNDRTLKVVVGSDNVIILSKNTPKDRVYVGSKFKMEFTSTGD